MTHTIIIPHRNRHEHLRLCLWSIRRSAGICGVFDYLVVVVDNGSDPPPVLEDDGRSCRVRLVRDFRPMPIFNKSALLNLGLELTRDGVVTILDADAIVGQRFMSGIEPLAKPKLTRICYRVRSVVDADLRAVLACHSPAMTAEIIDTLFGQYNDRCQSADRFRLLWEAYRFPDRNRHEPEQQPWGNSQFSMRRADIGDLRFDETMPGKGWEDIDFNRQVYAKYRDTFRGNIWTDPDHAMLHLTAPKKTIDWSNESIQMQNFKRYEAKWPVPCEKEQ